MFGLRRAITLMNPIAFVASLQMAMGFNWTYLTSEEVEFTCSSCFHRAQATVAVLGDSKAVLCVECQTLNVQEIY